MLKKELYEWGGESLNTSSSAMGTLSNFENTKDGRKICTLCGMTFSTMANAQRHFRNQHTSTERIQCQIANCQKNFKNNHSYTEHLRISHGTSKSMLNISQITFLNKISIIYLVFKKIAYYYFYTILRMTLS